MRILTPLVSLLFCVVSPELASAQAYDVGLTVSGGGLRVGANCSAVPCGALPMRVTTGTVLSVAAWGQTGSSYLLAIGLPTTTCVRVPGFSNQLLLGAPILVFRTGVMGRPNLLTRCRIGMHTGTLTVPRGTSGVRVHMQALAQSQAAGGPAFTQTIALTVQ